MLGTIGDRLRFRHDLLREVVYQDLPLPFRVRSTARRPVLSPRRALRPSKSPGTSALVAEPGDLEAVEWLVRAADEAGTTAPAMGVDLLDRASPSCLSGPMSSLRADRARLLVWAGRIGDGVAEALRCSRPGSRKRPRSTCGRVSRYALLMQGRGWPSRSASSKR